MLEVSLQQIFALTPSTLSRYLEFAQDILFTTLKRLEAARIAMPRCLEEFESLSNLITQRHQLLQGAFSSIDGLSLTAQELDDPEIENATYNGWKSNHCINNVLVFPPECVYTSFNCPAITFTVVIISRCYHICCPQLARKLA